MHRERAPILEIDNVYKSFTNAVGVKTVALNSVSLQVGVGETVALVGESGSGKSTLGRIALGLCVPDQGTVKVLKQDLSQIKPNDFRRFRTAIQPIFQDPTASLNPRRTVHNLLSQAVGGRATLTDESATEILNSVGLSPGFDYLKRLPHELSGGQRQRLAIARALVVNPKIIIADEALSGTDVSIRGQILNVFADIRDRLKVSYLMITHDMSVAQGFAHRIAVMKQGEIVEIGLSRDIMEAPQHEYTKRLLAAVPKFVS